MAAFHEFYSPGQVASQLQQMRLQVRGSGSERAMDVLMSSRVMLRPLTAPQNDLSKEALEDAFISAIDGLSPIAHDYGLSLTPANDKGEAGINPFAGVVVESRLHYMEEVYADPMRRNTFDAGVDSFLCHPQTAALIDHAVQLDLVQPSRPATLAALAATDDHVLV